MPSRRTLVGALAGAPLARAAHAAPAVVLVEGLPFARSALVGGAELRLNGTGVRAAAWLKGYAAGLYLRAPARSAAEAVAMPGPKRLQMRMLQEVASTEFSKAFHKGVRRNSTAQQVAALEARMAEFERRVDALRKVAKKDVVDLDFDPARGTLFSFNGTLRGDPIPGEDFYAALLRAFLGDRPYDDKLKAGLLGRA
jgi:hypothetical protein